MKKLYSIVVALLLFCSLSSFSQVFEFNGTNEGFVASNYTKLMGVNPEGSPCQLPGSATYPCNVDTNQTSAAQQNVMSIPTLAIFKGGELVAQQVGALSKTQLTEFIESNL